MIFKTAAWLSASLALAVSAVPIDEPQQQIVLGSEHHETLVDVQDMDPNFEEAMDFVHHHRPIPPMHPPIIDKSDQTIFQILNESLHHEPDHHRHFAEAARPPHRGPPPAPPLHIFAKFLNFTQNDGLFSLLDSSDSSLSLLAPDDFALKRILPPHHHHDHDGPPHDHPPPHPPHLAEEEAQNFWSNNESFEIEEAQDEFDLFGEESPFDLSNLFTEILENESQPLDASAADLDGERIDKLRKFIALVIRYHTLNEAYIGRDLADKSTAATVVDDLRVRVSPGLTPFSLRFNFLSHTRGPVIKAKNGYIYLLNFPLLLPLPPMQTLFVLPQFFSTLTSGLQKVHVNVSTFGEHHHDHGMAEGEVSPVVSEIMQELVDELPGGTHYTVFAPINAAFARLGFKVNAFLFSPFGRHVLKDVLSYHVVKDVTFFTDHIDNHTNVDACKQHKHPEHPDLTLRCYDLVTEFNSTVLPTRVYEHHSGPGGKGPLRRDIWLGDRDDHPVPVLVPDGPAFKGAYHIIGQLLAPPQYLKDPKTRELFRQHHRDGRPPILHPRPPHRGEPGPPPPREPPGRGGRPGFPPRPRMPVPPPPPPFPGHHLD